MRSLREKVSGRASSFPPHAIPALLADMFQRARRLKLAVFAPSVDEAKRSGGSKPGNAVFNDIESGRTSDTPPFLKAGRRPCCRMRARRDPAMGDAVVSRRRRRQARFAPFFSGWLRSGDRSKQQSHCPPTTRSAARSGP